MTLKELTFEMLETTNPFPKPVEEIVFHDSCRRRKSLFEMICAELPSHDNHGDRKGRCYKAITVGMSAYAEEYPGCYSYMRKLRKRLVEWLECIKERYEITDAAIPPELKTNPRDGDKCIAMLKELHSRDGVSRGKLAEALGISDRAVSTDLGRLVPGAEDPMTIGGQPVSVRVRKKYRENDRNAYWYTPNTVHPIVLQENLLQAGILLQALSAFYYGEHGSGASVGIGIDIWYQLSPYAQERIREVFATNDTDMQDFLAIIEDETPDDHIAGFQTERELFMNGDLDGDDIAVYLAKVPGRKQKP